MPTGLHSLLVGGIDKEQDAFVTCGQARMADSVTEGGSDEARSGRSVTGVQHRSVL